MTTKYPRVLAAFETSYPGIMPDATYCLFTGAPIGNHWELDDLIESIEGDPEEIADDIAMRLFASMRPSMRWNKMRSESLDQLAKSQPVETICYLLNRLFAPLHTGNYLPLHHERIQLFNHLSVVLDEPKTDSDDKDRDAILMQLLELDARKGLHRIGGLIRCIDILNDCTTWKQLLALLTPWYSIAVERLDREDMSTRYLNANPLARQAFFTRVVATRPPSKIKVKETAKLDDFAFFESVFAAANNEREFASPLAARGMLKPVIIDAKPTVSLPSTKMPMKFGVKKVESNS